MAPSSIHENGNRYEWEQAPDEFVIEKAAGITLFSAWPAVYKPKDCQMRPFCCSNDREWNQVFPAFDG